LSLFGKFAKRSKGGVEPPQSQVPAAQCFESLVMNREDRMNCKLISLCLILNALLLSAFTARAQQAQIDRLLDGEMPSLLSTYKSLHAAPELSHHEEKTAAFVAEQLRALGYTVTDHIGKYAGHPEWVGYGVVGVLKNGDGPTVYVRTELDALPVQEMTGLPYASKVRTKDDAGREVGVMHACGHDIHITSLLGTAKMLVELKGQWHGTLVMLAQPAEEAINGAKAMMDDGLYTRFPRPDYVLALHDAGSIAAGKVGYTPGYALASSTAVDVTLRGVGGHGSAPQVTKDPIVEAAEFIMAIQTIVSRENSPFDPAVVTVGSIHGGTRYNIIPDEVHLQLTIRTYKEEVRQHILAALDRMARGIAAADDVPASRAPTVTTTSEFTPATYNDPQLTMRLAEDFKKALGADHVAELPPVMASEDFCRFGLEDHQIPICQFTLGAVDAEKLAESQRTGVPLPGVHSALWAPVPEPTLRTGVKAMTSAVLDLMK
jgi:hippurate hydrolase